MEGADIDGALRRHCKYLEVVLHHLFKADVRCREGSGGGLCSVDSEVIVVFSIKRHIQYNPVIVLLEVHYGWSISFIITFP